MEQEIVQLLFGSGGIGVMVIAIMKAVKKAWKPENKKLYKIPAGLLSLGGGYVAMQSLSVDGTWTAFGVYLLISAFIMGFQLYGENEAWDDIKKIFPMLLKTLLKK